jgi:hypothetical protein
MHFDDGQTVAFTYGTGDVLEIEEQNTCIVHLYSLSVMSTDSSGPAPATGIIMEASLTTGGGLSTGSSEVAPDMIGNAMVTDHGPPDRGMAVLSLRRAPS